MLTLTPNLSDPDGCYDLLIAAHEGLTKAESDALNARLILILMNHLGDKATFAEAIKAAKASGSGE
ncbi:MAG: DUF2783 domain-containing protein [Pseudomonadota bacterium]